MARTKKKVKTPEETIQDAIATMVHDGEYRPAASMQDGENRDFESLVDMLECRRNEKDYEWMSDNFIPEMNSIVLTDSSQWANQYFQSRDFVEAKLDGDGPNDMNKAEAAKKLINKTLNDRDLYYYPKYIRLRTINALRGHCYILGWWEQELRQQEIELTVNALDETGQAIIQKPKKHTITRPVVDRFNFDVLDPRNVFTDNKYSYSAQHKDWIIIRSEMSYDELKANEKKNGYINLDKVKQAVKDRRTQDKKTDTARETYAKEAESQINNTPVAYFDVLDRYGKFWAIVAEKDSYGNPSVCTPGIDEQGMPLDNAELIEMIITFVVIGTTKIMIRFEPTPFIDAVGKPYKPIARGWCYIHPSKDEGLSDGKYMRELQIAINDTFNMASDRTKLATLPVFKGKKYSLEDNQTVYIEPEHVIELEDPNDLQELRITDNVNGALEQLGMLTSKMQQVTATYPHSMGALPDKSSTTATAVAGADQRTNARANYKSLTFEYTFFNEFYWIILQMTHRFAHDETLVKMLGKDAQFFDANADYTYTPVTSNIEAEYSKQKKIQLYDQSIGRISGLVQSLPELIPIIARMVGRQMVLLGDEFNEIGPMISNLAKAKPQKEGETPNQIKDLGAPATSNQAGSPILPMEAGARESSMTSGGLIK